MQSVLNTLIHNAQLIIVFAFVLLSLLGGIFRKVQEQREVQRRKAAAERARLEMLRTGRGSMGEPIGRPMNMPEPVYQPQASGTSMGAPIGPPTSAAEALARLEEIARRRQEQMGKVRGGQGAGQTQQQPRRGNDATGPVIVMGPSGPIVIRPGQQIPGIPAGVPAGKKGKQQRQQQQQQRQGRQKQQARPTPPPEPQPSMHLEDMRAAVASSAPAVSGTRAKAVLPAGTPRTPEEWRRLAAANAIFGRPVGEAGAGDSGPGRLF